MLVFILLSLIVKYDSLFRQNFHFSLFIIHYSLSFKCFCCKVLKRTLHTADILRNENLSLSDPHRQ